MGTRPVVWGLTIIIAWSLAAATDPEKSTGDELSMTLELIDDHHLAGLDLRLRVSVCGAASDGTWIPNLLSVGGNLEFVTQGPDDSWLRVVDEWMKFQPFSREGFLNLRRDHCLSRTVAIAGRHLQKPGTYRTRAIYYSEDDGSRAGVTAWTGSVGSDWLSVDIDAPSVD